MEGISIHLNALVPSPVAETETIRTDIEELSIVGDAAIALT